LLPFALYSRTFLHYMHHNVLHLYEFSDYIFTNIDILTINMLKRTL